MEDTRRSDTLGIKMLKVALAIILAVGLCPLPTSYAWADRIGSTSDEQTSATPAGEVNSEDAPENGIALMAADEDFYQDAENANLYHIANLDGMKKFRDSVNGGTSYAGKTVQLDADVDLAGSAENQWTPIDGFGGTFDGQNHTISNLYIVDTSTTGRGFGLFGTSFEFGESPKTMTLKNFTINNVVCKGNSAVAAVLGQSNGGEIENVHVTGNILIGTTTNNVGEAGYNSSYIGGIVGHNWYGLTINNCSVTGDGESTSLIGGRQVAGIIGFTSEAYGGGTVIANNCTVKNITIAGSLSLGGIIGWSHWANDVTNCSVENITINYTGDITEAHKTGLISGSTYSNESEGYAVNDYIGNTATNSKINISGNEVDRGLPTQLYSIYGSVSYIDHGNNSYSYYDTLAGAINASKDGETVGLLEDASEKVTVNKNITLDLGGNTLYGDFNAVAITNNATLTIKNGKLDGVAGNIDNEHLTLINVETYEIPVTASITKDGVKTNYSSISAAVTAAQNGDVIVVENDTNEQVVIPEGKTITITINEGKTWTTEQQSALINNGTVTLNGKGTITSPLAKGVSVLNYGTANIHDGIFSTKYVTLFNIRGSMNVYGGTITSSAYATYPNGGTLTFYGGVFKGSLYGTLATDTKVYSI